MMSCKNCTARCVNAGKNRKYTNCTAYKEASKPTNKEYIQNMNVNQLAIFLCGVATNTVCAVERWDTKDFWKKWLESEV